jgi:hypothetical protein
MYLIVDNCNVTSENLFIRCTAAGILQEFDKMLCMLADFSRVPHGVENVSLGVYVLEVRDVVLECPHVVLRFISITRIQMPRWVKSISEIMMTL